jgi:hypothetical protein
VFGIAQDNGLDDDAAVLELQQPSVLLTADLAKHFPFTVLESKVICL